MELHQEQVPSDEVWVVVTTYGDESTPYSDWFITKAGSLDFYQQQVHWITTHHGGEVTRWHVSLPRQRMEYLDVEAWVQKGLSMEGNNAIRRLDIYRKEPS